VIKLFKSTCATLSNLQCATCGQTAEKATQWGGRANTHGKITTHEKVLFVNQVLLVFSCLSFSVQKVSKFFKGGKKQEHVTTAQGSKGSPLWRIEKWGGK
jgi:hypothetical protein